jgi:WD40 repeat protein
MKYVLASLSVPFLALSSAFAQGAPNIVWQVPTPSALANSVIAVAWSPTDDQIVVGSNDRWFRARYASTGALQYSVLEPIHSQGPGHILYSNDGTRIGVRNQTSGLSFRVQRAIDGVFLGNVVASVSPAEIVSFAPDAMLLANTGGDGTISSWQFADITMFRQTGSGYQTVTTAFDFSPNGLLQTATLRSHVFERESASGMQVFLRRPAEKVEFSPDSSLLAVWASTPVNAITLLGTIDGSVVQTLTPPNPLEGVSALRFSPDGQRLVVTGYSPYIDSAGLWQQNGYIRFWDLASGTIVATFDQQTDLGVTSPVAFSPDGSQFAYGTYNGTVAVAQTP